MKMWLKKFNIGKSYGSKGITIGILSIWQDSRDDKVMDSIMSECLKKTGKTLNDWLDRVQKYSSTLLHLHPVYINGYFKMVQDKIM